MRPCCHPAESLQSPPLPPSSPRSFVIALPGPRAAAERCQRGSGGRAVRQRAAHTHTHSRGCTDGHTDTPRGGCPGSSRSSHTLTLTRCRSRRVHARPGLHQLNSLARLFLLMQQIKLLYRRRKHTRHGVLWRSTQPRLLSSTPEGMSFPRLPRLCRGPQPAAGLLPGGLTLPPGAHGSDKHIPLQSSVLCSRLLL